MPGILQLWPLNACNALIVVHPPNQYFSIPRSILFQPSINNFPTLDQYFCKPQAPVAKFDRDFPPSYLPLLSLHLNSGLVAFKLPASETHHGSQQLSQGLDIGTLGQLQKAWMHIVHISNSCNGNNGISNAMAMGMATVTQNALIANSSTERMYLQTW